MDPFLSVLYSILSRWYWFRKLEPCHIRAGKSAGLGRAQMIIYCEECGAKNVLGKLPQNIQNDPIRCRFCNDILVIHHNNALAEDYEETAKPVILSRLVLKFQNLVVVHEGPNHQITLGRHEDADIRVQDERVSRLHATVVYKQGKYCLIDRSLNGTYILVKNRYGTTIKHKQIMLVSQGIIGLGGIVEETSPNAIHYSIRSPGSGAFVP